MAYVGFKALVAKGVPPGAAANIGRKKYGKKNFQKHAAEGKKMKNSKPVEGSEEEEATESPEFEAKEDKPMKKHKKMSMF